MSSTVLKNDKSSRVRDAGYAPESRHRNEEPNTWGASRQARVNDADRYITVNHESCLEQDDTRKDGVEEKFNRLRNRWKSEMMHVSSTTKRVLHPSYQAIIGMGQVALPFLFKELERNVDSWFWALHAITEADPSPPEARGDGQAMAKAWLEWAEHNGYRW